MARQKGSRGGAGSRADETSGQRRTKKSTSAAKGKGARGHVTRGKDAVRRKSHKKRVVEKRGKDSKQKNTKAATVVKPTAATGQRKSGELKGKSGPRKELPLVARAKKYWERLRKHDIKKEERVQIMNQLLELVVSHIHELVLKHDGARVIQCLLKYGTEQVRGLVYEELKDHIPELCRIKYAKFTIKAMLKYCPSQQRDGVISGMYGHVAKLVRHREAAEIIEAAYNDHANALQRALLTQEFFGPQYALFKKKTGGDMATILSAHPDKKKLIDSMKQSLCPLLDKGAVKHSIVHHALLEFFLHADHASRAEMIELVREMVVEMLHTREGTKVALQCLWYGTAKDRKAIVKSFKTFVSKICKEESGHIVLLGVFDCVDDTVLVRKAILSELIGSLEELCDHKIGRRVILYLLNPRCSLHFTPQFISLLTPGDSNQHSKKPADVRWAELREAVSGPLIELATLRATQWSRSKPHAPLLIQIASSAAGDVSPVYESLCRSLAVDLDHEQEMEETTHHLVNDDCGHWTVRRILALGDHADDDTPRLASIVLDTVPCDQLLKWAESNRGCFVLCSLVENVMEKERVGTVKMLTPLIDQLASSCSHNGGKVLINVLQTLSQTLT